MISLHLYIYIFVKHIKLKLHIDIYVLNIYFFVFHFNFRFYMFNSKFFYKKIILSMTFVRVMKLINSLKFLRLNYKFDR